MTNSSILKLLGAFHWVKTSRILFWAFSYSIGEPCERSVQVSMYFIDVLVGLVLSKKLAVRRVPPHRAKSNRNQPRRLLGVSGHCFAGPSCSCSDLVTKRHHASVCATEISGSLLPVMAGAQPHG